MSGSSRIIRGLRPRHLTVALAGGILALAAAGERADARGERVRKVSEDPRIPVTVVVDLSRQRLQAYAGTQPVWSSRISSGKPGHRTPQGVFSIIQKRREHYSNLYNGAPMPHMQRLTWSGIALHGGPIPGYPASHGCVRLPYANARRLFSMTRMNTRVIVSHADPRPTAIDHPVLWDRLPPGNADAPLAASGARGSSPAQGGLSGLIGVTPAHADTLQAAALAILAKGPARTRAELKARREAELALATRATRETARRRDAREAAYEAQHDAVGKLADNLRRAQRAQALAERNARNLSRKHTIAIRRLEQLLTANLDLEPQAVAYDRLAEREQRLEDDLAEIAGEYRLARETADQFAAVAEGLKPKLAEDRAALERARADLEAARVAAADAQAHQEQLERLIRLSQEPVQLLASRADRKLYVRQGNVPMFEAPISFAKPDQPIGTHVLTAVDESEDGRLTWSTVTVPDRKYDAARESAALDRLVIPAETSARIREMVKVGASLIVSDRGPSHETGKGTGFVILTQ